MTIDVNAPKAAFGRSEGVRLQRVLAEAGIASRRKAEALIEEGRVTVDGLKVTRLGTRIDPAKSTVRVDGKLVRRAPFRYIVMNKPSGFITTTSDERERHTVMDLLPARAQLNPVGRLDRDTEGLLLFTNDGEVANRVMHPRYRLTKEYSILTPGKPAESVMARVRRGILVDGKRVVPEEFRIVREHVDGVVLSMVIHEGMNRVVRRVMDEVGIPVTKLHRTRIGPLSVAGIPRGAHRELTPGEVTSLLQALHIDRESQTVAPSGRTSSRGRASSASAQREQARPRRSGKTRTGPRKVDQSA